MTSDVIRYSSSELLEIRNSVTNNNHFRTIDPFTCVTIKALRLNKRRGRRRKCRRRGGKDIRQLKHIHTSAKSDGNDIHFLLLNARSIKCKEFLIREEIDSTDAEFVVVTETWLRANDASWVECSQFNRDGYKMLAYNRQVRTGGGLALIYKDKYIVNTMEKGQMRSFEYLVCTIRIRGTVITLVIIYHPPYSRASCVIIPIFIDEITEFLPNVLVKYTNIIMLGDFNLHLDSDDPDAVLFSDILDAMGLIPHISVPTPIAGHTLDQIYSVLNSRGIVRNCSQSALLSDHYAILGHIVIPHTATHTIRTVKARKLKNIDISTFMEDINTDAIPLTDIDEAVTALDTELLSVLDKQAPIKELKVTDRKKELWYEDHIKLQKRIVRNHEFIWNRFDHQDHHWKAFTIERNRFNRMVAGAKIRANSEKVLECGHDTKKLYNLVNNITGRVKSNPMPPGRTNGDLADAFADFFLNKIIKIRNDLSECNAYSPIPIEVEPLSQFQPMSVAEVIKIIWSMPTKTCESMSAAFDTVDHNILLNVLEDRFGIKDSSLKWVDSYLRPRSLRVCVGDAYSSVRSLDFSVPQGSGAGPSFYSAYASTMRDIVPATVDIHGYADDHALKKAFKASSKTDEITSIASLRSVIFDIKSWMDENRLKMNNSKTEFILFGSRQQLAKLTTTTIDINGVLTNRSPSIRYLGADLDERLTLGGMITRKCRVAMGNLQKLKLIRKCRTLSTATTVALGLVIAHLDYANALYSGLPAVEIQKLQRIQNTTANIVTGVNKHASSTTALKSLHWLQIRLRIEFKIATLVFRSLHGLAPSYLRDLIRPVSVTRRGLRSQTKACILEVPFNRRKTFADRAFSTYGPRTWNLLPEDLRSLTDYQPEKT